VHCVWQPLSLKKWMVVLGIERRQSSARRRLAHTVIQAEIWQSAISLRLRGDVRNAVVVLLASPQRLICGAL